MSIGTTRYKNKVQKGILYDIKQDTEIFVKESHKDDETNDICHIKFRLKQGEFGIFANEYKPANMKKQGAKKPDILCGIIHDDHVANALEVADMKRNIMSFQSKDPVDVTIALDNITKFIDQMEAGYFMMLQVCAAEQIHLHNMKFSYALLTRKWEVSGFMKVIEELKKQTNTKQTLSILRNKKVPEVNKNKSIETIQNFMHQRFMIGNELCDFQVIKMEKKDHRNYQGELMIQMTD